MFGYVVPCKEEMKIREYNQFKAVYCGLCKALGHNSNQLTRFGLNYDFTFLALLLSALDNEDPQIEQESCISNPIKKKPIVRRNKHLDYAADLNTIFVYLKLLDNWHDEHSVKALLTMPVFYLPTRRKQDKYQDKYNFFVRSLNELTELESCHNNIVDKSADVFSRIMAAIFVPDYIRDEKQRRILNTLGYNLGRWIYILDAFSDLEEDIKNNTYNPLLEQYKYRKGENLEVFIDRIVEAVEFSLTFTLNNVGNSYQLLEVKRYNEILENTIYIGLYKVMKKKLANGGRSDERSLQNTGS